MKYELYLLWCCIIGMFAPVNLYAQMAVADSVTRSAIIPCDKPKTISFAKSKGHLEGCADMATLYYYSFTGKSKLLFSDSNYGKIYPQPVLQGIDSSKAQQLYNYTRDILSPAVSKEEMGKIMQRDLDNYFNCESAIEIRRMPYWSLARNNHFNEQAVRTSDSMKQKVKEGLRGIDAIPNGVIFRDFPINNILSLIYANNRMNKFDHPLINETGIDYNIDLRLESFLTDKEGVIRELARNGFDLTVKQREMKVVVIKAKTKLGKTSISKQDSLGWQYLDPGDDGVYGISLDKTYRELLASKKPDTIIVAVIDGGVDTLHKELRELLWQNRKEKGQDEDGNGYAGDFHGWNFLGGKNDNNIIQVWDEFRREYLRLGKKYASKKVKPKQDEYKLWLRVKEDFRKDSVRRVGLYLEFQKHIKNWDSILRAQLGKEIYTGEDLNKYEPVTKEQKAAKVNMLSQFKRDSISTSLALQKFFNRQGLKEFTEELLQGDPVQIRKKITGDDYTNLKDPFYGNNDIMVDRPDGKRILKHGTHVAGIIGLHAPVKVMIIRAIPDGDEYDKDIALAIRYATDNGARIINMSFAKELSPHRRWVEEAISYAAVHDVLLIHAAGNNNRNTDSFPLCPTAISATKNKTAANMITVGASGMTKDKLISNFSNYGQSVDVLAPGTDIYATIPGDQYGKMSGTSMAAAVVSGMAAILRAYYPALSAKEVKYIIGSSVIKIKEPVYRPGTQQKVFLNARCRTGGIVNLYNAVREAERMSDH